MKRSLTLLSASPPSSPSYLAFKLLHSSATTSFHAVFDKLPREIIWSILSFVELKTLFNCMLVCKKWFKIIECSSEGASLYHQLFQAAWLKGRRVNTTTASNKIDNNNTTSSKLSNTQSSSSFHNIAQRSSGLHQPLQHSFPRKPMFFQQTKRRRVEQADLGNIQARMWKAEYKQNLEVQQSQPIQSLSVHNDEVWFVKWSNSGKFAASAGKDGQVIVWKLIDNQTSSDSTEPRFKLELYRSLKAGTQCSFGWADWSSDDTYLLVSQATNNQPKVWIWDYETNRVGSVGNKPYDCYGVFSALNTDLFVHGGRFTILGADSYQQEICIVNIKTMQPALKLVATHKRCHDYIHSFRLFNTKPLGVYMSGDSYTFGCKNIKIIDLSQVDFASLSHQQVTDPHVLSLNKAFTIPLNGICLGYCLSDDDKYIFINVRPFVTNKEKSSQHQTEKSQSQETSPDDDSNMMEAEYSSVPTLTNKDVLSEDFELCVWDVEQQKMVWTLTGHKGFSPIDQPFCIWPTVGGPSKQYVTSGSEDGNVYIWHRDYGTLIGCLKAHEALVTSCHWHPHHEHLLLSASDDCTIKLWQTKSL